MRFVNHTWFPARCIQGVAPGGDRFHVAILRQSFDFASGSLEFTEPQAPFVRTDVCSGEPNQSSILAESDFCQFKPACDVIVNGVAHAPGGWPARSFHVRLRVLPGGSEAGPGSPLIDKTLLVSGPSEFRQGAAVLRGLGFLLKVATFGLVRPDPWFRTWPEPVLDVPVRYEYAYGGGARVAIDDRRAGRVPRRHWLPGADREAPRADFQATGKAAPLAWAVHEANPIGLGFAQAWHLKATRTRRLPAPQVEAPHSPVTAQRFCRWLQGRDLDDPALEPQGFGILDKAWWPRRARVGTADEAWAASDAPLPADFDFAIWNGAPPDQQVPYLKGDETVELTNLVPRDTPGVLLHAHGHTTFEVKLPGHQPYLFARYENGGLANLPLNLDTLVLDTEQRTLALVWRLALPLEPPLRVLEARIVLREHRQAWQRRGGPVLIPPATAGVNGGARPDLQG